MPPTGGPAGVPGCCNCGAAATLACAPCSPPAEDLWITVDGGAGRLQEGLFHYRKDAYWEHSGTTQAKGGWWYSDDFVLIFYEGAVLHLPSYGSPPPTGEAEHPLHIRYAMSCENVTFGVPTLYVLSSTNCEDPIDVFLNPTPSQFNKDRFVYGTGPCFFGNSGNLLVNQTGQWPTKTCSPLLLISGPQDPQRESIRVTVSQKA